MTQEKETLEQKNALLEARLQHQIIAGTALRLELQNLTRYTESLILENEVFIDSEYIIEAEKTAKLNQGKESTRSTPSMPNPIAPLTSNPNTTNTLAQLKVGLAASNGPPLPVPLSVQASNTKSLSNQQFQQATGSEHLGEYQMSTKMKQMYPSMQSSRRQGCSLPSTLRRNSTPVFSSSTTPSSNLSKNSSSGALDAMLFSQSMTLAAGLHQQSREQNRINALPQLGSMNTMPAPINATPTNIGRPPLRNVSSYPNFHQLYPEIQTSYPMAHHSSYTIPSSIYPAPTTPPLYDFTSTSSPPQYF